MDQHCLVLVVLMGDIFILPVSYMFVVVPLLIVLIVKVRRLESAVAANQGAVNVAVAAPAMIPMQTMTTEPARQSAASFPTPGGDKSDHLYNVVFH